MVEECVQIVGHENSLSKKLAVEIISSHVIVIQIVNMLKTSHDNQVDEGELVVDERVNLFVKLLQVAAHQQQKRP
jgi:hypothetical protein